MKQKAPGEVARGKWTRDHDIDLAVAYLGYTTTMFTPGGKKHLICPNGNIAASPDMTQRDCAETSVCLEMFFDVGLGRSAVTEVDVKTGFRVKLLVRTHAVGIGCGETINEALAWALWEARGQAAPDAGKGAGDAE